MDFYEVLDQAVNLLRNRGRVTYRALQRQFELDDAVLEDLKNEILFAHPETTDEGGHGLIWAGALTTAAGTEIVSSPTSASTAPAKSEPLAYTPQHLAEKILTTRSALEGERKHVTVMFADIKDSTELIRDLDPEAAQQLLDPAIHIMMDAVHRFEGTVNQVLGDGVMAIFGAPIAHEDHAARACYAALAMQAAMRPYADAVRHTHGITMRIRVGLNSGEVVVRTIGNDLHMDYSAVGQTTNLASRMEQLAAPGSITLTATTLRLVEGLVRINDSGPVPVKGMTEPVEVYELTGASTIKRRLQAAVSRGLTKFVGRETEIDALNQARKRVEAGNGQIVAAIGEAGVGKSRLAYEFIHSHRTEGWRVLESASVSYGKATPYFPVVDLLKRYVQVEDGDDSRTIQAKVTGQILTLNETLQETIPPLLSLLDALPEDSPFLQLEPRQRRQRTLDGLKRILIRESQVQPLLLVFEDLHWIDTETQALLDSLVESLPTAKLLLLVNYRPEYQHSWGSKTFYTQLRLDPLPSERADEFLAALLGDDPGLEALKKLLVERTEGNPFFLEESVRTLVETKTLVDEAGAYRLAQASPTIEVPATVQAILAARIDRLLQEEKRLLQTAAVIGTEVPLTLLQAIAEISEETLYRDLTHLQAAEFLYETSLFPEHVYTFKHALTHEVAYGSLLQGQRRMLHARIVEILETLAGDRLEDQVERLAHHAFRGEVWDKALMYFRQAGENARARSADREAVGYFEQALSVLPYLAKQHDTREQALNLRLALRSALQTIGDWERILVVLREAETLAEMLADTWLQARVSGFLSVHLYHMGTYDQAITAAQRVIALATAREDGVLHALGNHYLGFAYRAQGDYRQAIACHRQTVFSLDETQSRERFGQSSLPAVNSRAHLAWCHAELGTFAEGRALGEEGLYLAEEVAHPISVIIALWGLGLLDFRQGDLARALPRLKRAMRLCLDVDVPALFPRVAAPLGAAYTLSDCVTDAVQLLTQAMEQTMTTEMVGEQSICRLALVEAQLSVGRLKEAHALAEQALAFTRRYQERGYQAHALRLLGESAIYRDPPDLDQAESYYRQALTLAIELGMRPLQAHCYRGLGTLYRQTGRPEQGRAELSTAIEMYRNMEMTFWLPQTEAALAQVEDEA